MTIGNIMSSGDLGAGGAETRFPRKALVIGQVIKTYKYWVEVREEDVINYFAEFYPAVKNPKLSDKLLREVAEWKAVNTQTLLIAEEGKLVDVESDNWQFEEWTD